MRWIAGIMAAGLALLLQGCFEIDGDLEDPYIKPADMAAPLRSGFYQICSASRYSAPECMTGEVRSKADGYELIEYPRQMTETDRAEFEAARGALLQRPQGEYVFTRLEVPAERLADLPPAEAEVETAPLFLVGQRSFEDGEISRIRYGLARYDAEGYWEMWEPKCSDIPVGALAGWVRQDWLTLPKEKLSDVHNETCTFAREGLDDMRLRLILSRADKYSFRRLYWRGEENPDEPNEGEEQ